MFSGKIDDSLWPLQVEIANPCLFYCKLRQQGIILLLKSQGKVAAKPKPGIIGKANIVVAVLPGLNAYHMGKIYHVRFVDANKLIRVQFKLKLAQRLGV